MAVGRETSEDGRAYARGHVVADGEERRPGGPRRDEAEERVGVVDGGCVEQRGVGLGESAHGGEHRSAREASQVPRAARPPQRSRSGGGGRRPRVRGRLHFFPHPRLLAWAGFFLSSSDDVGTFGCGLWPLGFGFLQTGFLFFISGEISFHFTRVKF